jgi:cytochrome c
MIPYRGIAVLCAALCSAAPVRAALKWTGCSDLSDSEFKATSLATFAKDGVEEPMRMAFDLRAAPGEDAKGKVDVYFTERQGRVRKYDAGTGSVSTLGTLSLQIDPVNSSDGVMGIALDPGFKANHRIYLYYTYVSSSEKSWRISRFTLDANNAKLDASSEIPVLKIPIRPGSKHPGGDIRFDAYGDLWISVGNDAQDGKDYPLYSSPNTNDLRGKILRIHPTDDGKYTIPEGNLFPAGTDKTRPEIYIMGNRNPYTLALDPVRRWVMWGDVGPDNKNFDGDPMNSGGSEKTEEYDLATAPGNYGYPFFAGDFATRPGTNADAPAMPAGYTWEGADPGLTTLPKAIPPIYAYRKACAITGPLYRYDGDLNSSVKFPPHLHRKWLVTDFNGDNNPITAFTLKDDGSAITAQDRVIATVPLHAPLDLEFGPDGALYVVNYAGYRSSGGNTGLIRIDYTGSCHPDTPKLETPTSTSIAGRGGARGGPRVEILRGRRLAVSVHAEGRIDLEVRDLSGRSVLAESVIGSAPVPLDALRDPGVYFLRVRSAAGARVLPLVKD